MNNDSCIVGESVAVVDEFDEFDEFDNVPIAAPIIESSIEDPRADPVATIENVVENVVVNIDKNNNKNDTIENNKTEKSKVTSGKRGGTPVRDKPDVSRSPSYGRVTPKDRRIIAQIDQSENDYASGDIESIIQNKLSGRVRLLNTFIKQFVTEKGTKETNVQDVMYKKTFFVPSANKEEMFTLLEQCRIERRMLHYAERQETSLESHSGLMLDFDCYTASRKTLFNNDLFITLAQCVSTFIGRICDIPRGFTHHVFIIQKPEPVVDAGRSERAGHTVYKDGFHMLCPEVWLSRPVKKFLIAEMAEAPEYREIFAQMPFEEAPEKMLDKMSASVPVLFFGNTNPGKTTYDLTFAAKITINTFGTSAATLVPADLISKYNMTYELSLSTYLKELVGYPTLLTKAKFEPRGQFIARIQLANEKSAGDIIGDQELFETENTVDILAMNNPEANYLKQLLAILDISYATEYEKWFKVIAAIAHCSPSYKPLAIWFSHRQPNSWSPSEIERIWLDVQQNRPAHPVTKRSIIHWARTCSPERFREIDQENYVQLLSRFVYSYEGVIQQGMVARVMYAMLREKFAVGIDNDRFMWFEFVCSGQSMKHGEIYKWRREVDPVNLHLYISDHMTKVYDQQMERLKDRKEAADSPELIKYWSKVEKAFKSSEGKLFDDAFQSKVIRQAQYRFYDRLFTDELDKYPDILGVGNGILLLGVEPKLISGFHEYKISKFIPTDYIPFDPNNYYIKTLLQIFRDIFIEDDVFNFAMYHAATALDGRPAAFLIWLINSDGQNGKSTYAKMITELMTDEFVCPLKSNLITGAFEKANEANSAQAQMRGKKWVYFDEFEPGEEINTSRIKSIVGGGKQTGRDVYEKQGSFRNTCNKVALNNHGYIIKTSDHGSWRRIYYYNAKTKFTENPNPNNKYERKDNPDVENKYPEDPNFKQAMLSILVHYWAELERKYGGNLKRVPVPTIEAETLTFRNNQDMINCFITQMIVRSPHTTEEISLGKICDAYLAWYNAKGIKRPLETNDAIRKQFLNSRLNKSLVRGDDGTTCHLRECRIRANVDDQLQLGEVPY